VIERFGAVELAFVHRFVCLAIALGRSTRVAQKVWTGQAKLWSSTLPSSSRSYGSGTILMALVFVQRGDALPMTKAIQNLLSQYGTEWHLLAAGAFILMAVPLLVFFSLQRYFVQGLLAGSVK
jgi:hypothetical protein